MNMLKYVFGIIILAFSGGIASETKSNNLTFGLYTNDRPSALIRQFTPILNELESRMEEILEENVTIDLKITKTYDDAILLVADGTFDFVRFGPVSYTQAKEMNDGIRIVASESVEGEKVFYGIIATHENSDIETVADIKGSRFAFGAENSTIGRFLAQNFLVENEIFESDLLAYSYLGRHDLVGISISSGVYEVGALKENTFNSLVDVGHNLKELTRFPNVTKPWIVSSTMDERVADAMSKALLSIDNPKILSRLNIDGFLYADDSDYDIIRTSIDDNSLFFK